MPVVRPYRLCQPGLVDRISFGCSPRTAVLAWLYAFNKWKHPKGIEEYIERNEITVYELDSWRVVDIDNGYHHVFATDLRDATILSGVNPVKRIMRCDPYFVLFNTPRPELGNMVKTVWLNVERKNLKNEIHRLFPKFTLIHRTRTRHTLETRAYYKELVNGWAAMLRLAMTCPFFNGQTILVQDPKTYSNRLKIPAMEAREFMEPDLYGWFIELHKPNIGDRNCREVLAIVGPEICRSRTGYIEIKKALTRFIVAYGYNPDSMSWSEVIALWRGGPQLLERKRHEISMGMYDKFKDY